MNKLFIVIIITSMVVFSALAGGKGIVKPISGSQCLNFKAVAKVQCTGLYHIVGESRNCCDDPAKASASKSMNGNWLHTRTLLLGVKVFLKVEQFIELHGALGESHWLNIFIITRKIH